MHSLSAPDRSTRQGQRDYAVLLFLYNSGARASEAAGVLVEHLEPGSTGSRVGEASRQRQKDPLLSAVDQDHECASAAGLMDDREQPHCFSIVMANRSHVLASTRWWNGTRGRRLSRLYPYEKSASVRTLSATQPLPICFALAWISTLSVAGSDMCRWRPPMSMQKRTWRSRRRLSQLVIQEAERQLKRSGGMTRVYEVSSQSLIWS